MCSTRCSAHSWPGNVRELRNVLERAALLSGAAGKDEVQLGMLPFAGRQAPEDDEGGLALPAFDPQKSYRDTKAEFEAPLRKELRRVAPRERRRQHLRGRPGRRHGP